MNAPAWTVRCVYVASRPNGPPAQGPLTPTAEESIKFAAASGRALAEWQFIESGLVSLFEHCLTGGRSAGAVAAFHVLSTFRTRVEMCSAVMGKSGAPSPWIERWEQIADELMKLAKARNLNAHGITVFDATRPAGDRLFMTPHLNNPDRRSNVFDHSIGVGTRKLHAQAIAFGAAYEELVAYTTSFASAVKKKFPDGEMPPVVGIGKR